MLALKRLYWKWLYKKIDNSFIYKIIRYPHNKDLIRLCGPIKTDTIRLVNKKYRVIESYDYVQVVNGRVVATFKASDLLFSRERI